MRTVLLLVALVLPACAVTIGEVNPQPNVLLGPSTRQLKLGFANAVPEAMPLDIQSSNTIVAATISVAQWHETLSRGFHNGFDRYFAQSGPTSTLEILSATPQVFVAPRTGTLIIRYQAQLVDDKGTMLHRFAGTAVSPIPLTNLLDAEPVLQGAVENLYEQIATQMSAGQT
jgi:hypothetical protein